ncbi:MAG: DUF1592 domain-containing protein [Bacteriovoracaceae bacterium]|nr:DUF1592 domain-containing protein [Bacteriovoracaceae bacterium]
MKNLSRVNIFCLIGIFFISSCTPLLGIKKNKSALTIYDKRGTPEDGSSSDAPANAPSISLASSTYVTDDLNISISSGADSYIRYSLNNSSLVCDDDDDDDQSSLILLTFTKQDITLRAVACDSAGNMSPEVSAVYDYVGERPNPPIISVTDQIFNQSFNVQLSVNNLGNGKIRYAFNTSSLNNCNDGILYNLGTNISIPLATTVLKAIVCSEFNIASIVAMELYTYDNIAPQPPVISPSNIQFSNTISVSISGDNGAIIKYIQQDQNITNCNTAGLITYVNSFQISGTNDVVVSAIACDSLGNISPTTKSTYTYSSDAIAPPTYTPANQYFNDRDLSVALNSTTTGSSIRYIIGGAAPQTCSQGSLYSGAFALSDSSSSNFDADTIYYNDAELSDSSAPSGSRPTVVADRGSNVYNFDGSNDYIELNNLDINGNALTLTGWFKANSFGGSSRDNRFISKAIGTSEQDHYWMVSTIRSGIDTRLRFRLKTGGSTSTLIASSGNINTGSWNHFAATYDGSSMKLYLNGSEVGNLSKSGVLSSSSSIPASIGRNPSNGQYFDGRMEEVAILSKALTLAEIIGLKDSGMASINNGDEFIINAITCIGNAMSDVATHTYTFDDIIPVDAVLSTPAGGYNSAFALTLATTDTSEIRYTTNGSDLDDCSDGFIYSTPFNLIGQSLDLKIISCDAAGNKSVNQINASYYFDDVAPIINFIGSATETGTTSLTIVGDCESGLAVSLNGAGIVTSYMASCINDRFFKQVILTSGEGTKPILASSTDSAGNNSTAMINVSLDQDLPNLTISSPLDGASVDNVIYLVGLCETGRNISILGNGVNGIITGPCNNGNYSIAVQCTSDDGVKELIAQQTDSAGNTIVLSRNYIKNSAADEANRNIAARGILANHCLQCHGVNSTSVVLDLQTDHQFIVAGMARPGDIDNSPVIYRLAHYIGSNANAATNMPLSSNSFTTAHYNTLAEWVTQMRAPDAGSEDDSFICNDSSESSKSLSYVLTKDQYLNTLEDLFGADVITAAQTSLSTLSEEAFEEDTHLRLSTLSSASVESFFDVANEIATYIFLSTTKVASIFGACANGTNPAVSCTDAYLNGFAKKIFRRVLTITEINKTKAIMTAIEGDYKEKLKFAFSYHLINPAFLWRLEMGQANQNSMTKLQLTQYEVASRISFQATDSTPDDALLTAASNGQLATTAQVKAQTQRLLASQRGKDKVIKNIQRYSLTDFANDLSIIPAEVTQGVMMQGLENAMVDEAKVYIEKMVYTEGANFKELLTSNKSFASHPGLAQIYNHVPVLDQNFPAEIIGRRQGLLMRAPFLTGSETRTKLITRGVSFQKRVLCNEIPFPEIDITDERDDNALTHDQLLTTTTREAVRYQTDSPVCMACHNLINPAGNMFEGFDPIGKERTQELVFDQQMVFVHALQVNTDDTVPLTSTKSVFANDAFNFMTNLSTSSEGTACFSRNMFRFIKEKKEDSSDGCQLTDAQTNLHDTNSSVLESIVSIIANDAIQFKKME